MKRAGWSSVLFAALVPVLGVAAEAQQAKKVPRVAFLSLSSSGPDLRSEAFRQGLREFGYTEGQNIVVEYRWADGETKHSRDSLLSWLA